MVKQRWLWIILLAGLVIGSTGNPVMAKGEPYMTGFYEWQGTGFADWQLSGVNFDGDRLVMVPTGAVLEIDPIPPGGYYGGNFYNGGSYLVSEATSPVMAAELDFSELIVSWNADTPDGTWVETLARVQIGDRWTKWYNLGVWASGEGTIQRHSVKIQGDSDGYVAVDTLVLSGKKTSVTDYQIKVRFFSQDGSAVPTVRYISAAYSTAVPKKLTPSSGSPVYWNKLIPVPECSQMVYPDGGNVWCSPTSVSMVLSYWREDIRGCNTVVHETVEGVYDWIYDGHGNWVFNTAYAASKGFTASVQRFTSLDQVEPLINADIPVVFSFAWGKGDLTGAAIESSNGHLAIIVGFDEAGNPIVNDPAAASDADVQRTYLRSELEAVWLGNSGGTVYIIKP